MVLAGYDLAGPYEGFLGDVGGLRRHDRVHAVCMLAPQAEGQSHEWLAFLPARESGQTVRFGGVDAKREPGQSQHLAVATGKLPEPTQSLLPSA